MFLLINSNYSNLPREDLPKPILRSDVLKFEDLQQGMEVTGTVRNVIDFATFIFLKSDFMVSNFSLSDKFSTEYPKFVNNFLSDKYIKNPSEVVSVGDVVKVRVIGIDQEKHKVSLSMK